MGEIKEQEIQGIKIAHEIPDEGREVARKAQVVQIRWEDTQTGLQYVFFRSDLIKEMLRDLSKAEMTEVISAITKDYLNQ